MIELHGHKFTPPCPLSGSLKGCHPTRVVFGSVIFEELSSVSLESKTTSSPSISGVRVFTNFQGLRYVPFTGVSNVTLNGA